MPNRKIVAQAKYMVNGRAPVWRGRRDEWVEPSVALGFRSRTRQKMEKGRGVKRCMNTNGERNGNAALLSGGAFSGGRGFIGCANSSRCLSS